jgi:hypothetical protein
MHGSHRLTSVRLGAAFALLGLALAAAACTRTPKDPIVALNSSQSPEEQRGAIEALRMQTPLSEDAKRALRRSTFAQGFNLGIRQEAFDLLVQEERKGLQETLETNIVRMESYEFRRWIMEQIGARQMKDFTVVVVNSWAGPVPVWGPDQFKRPEFEAMAALYRRGGFGYGDVKKALVAAAADFFADARRRRAELAADPGTIDAILAEGAERARSRAGDVLSRAKRACGLSRLPGKPAGGKA